MNYNIDEIGIIEGSSRAVKCFFTEAPVRRPGLPQQAADPTAVRFQSGTPAFGVEIPLIPECPFHLRRGRLGRSDSVLNGIAADQNRCANAVRMQRGSNGGGAATPVVPAYREARQLKRIREIDQVLSDSRLFRH